MCGSHEIIQEAFLQNCVSRVKSLLTWATCLTKSKVFARKIIIYSVLVQDDNVLIVIGGDDEYRDENEEACSVISRCVRRKVASQFPEEYVDGRQSFIFS